MRPSMDHLTTAFAQRPGVAEQPPWLTDQQTEAWARAVAHGLPWRKDEHWKYTSLFGMAKLPLTVPAPANDATRIGERIYSTDNAIVIEWCNGRPVATNALPDGVTLDTVQDHGDLAHAPPTRASVMQDLNEAFADAQCLLRVAPNTHLEQPVYLVHTVTGTHSLASMRLHIDIGAGSTCRLVEHQVGDGQECVSNRRVTLVLGANSQVRHAQVVQDADTATQLSNVDVQVDRDAHYTAETFDLSGALSRHDLGISLNANNAQCTLLAVYLPVGGEHVDHHTIVKHNQPHTHSEQRYNGVAGARGHGVFNGKVLVAPDAQKISAAQSNQNILLTEKAAVDTKPELEIYADDVKCSHGATVGQLDETSLFYLQSRGLDAREARQLLVRGFVRDIYADLGCPTLHAWLDAAIVRKIDASEQL